MQKQIKSHNDDEKKKDKKKKFPRTTMPKINWKTK